MKANHYIAIGIRFFSVFLFLAALREALHFPELFMNGTINGMQAKPSYSVLSFLVTCLCALILWLFPSIIANSIIRAEMNQEVKPMNPLDFATVVVAGLGLYFLYYAVSDAVYWLTVVNIGQQTAYGTLPFVLDNYSKAAIVSTGVEFIISGLLVVKARVISKLIFRVVR